MSTPLVTIITPCYNSEKYVGRYIECLLSQTYNKIQLIIVNDGSNDKTEEIILNYKDALERKGIELIYLYQENKGLGGAINTGLKLITGEFFTWCDSDNLLTPDYFEEKVQFFLNHPEASIVRCDGYNVYDTAIDRPISRMADGNSQKYKKDLFYDCLMCKNFHFGCTMLRTDAFDKVNPNREIYPSREGQNWQIMLPMFYYYDSYYIDKPMFYFVIREDSISHAAIHKGLDALLLQNDECEKIEKITIQGMHIPEEKECMNIIGKQYAHIRFWLADKYGDALAVRKEYRNILDKNWSTKEIDKVHRRWKNIFWRIGHRMKAFCAKNRIENFR